MRSFLLALRTSRRCYSAAHKAIKLAQQQDLEQDILAWESLLAPEETAARDAVRAWVDARFAPRITEAHRRGAFPRDLIPELAELGVFGASLQGYGCAGMSSVAYGLVMQELERGDSALRSLCSVQGSLVMHAIHAFGSPEQRERWLPALAQGKLIGCFALTESSAGSDPAAMAATARRDGDAYMLEGEKAWITNAPIADLAVVFAKVADEDGRVRAFVVERGPGLEVHSVEGKLSLRASPTGNILLAAARGALLPGSGGLKSALQCLTQAREGIAWGVTGAAMDCFEAALDYGAHRQVFGRPLASRQLFQERLATMAQSIVTSQLMSLHFGRLKDQGRLTPVQVSLHKRHNVAAARRVASDARAMLGANGIIDTNKVMRHLMNLESVYTYEGTDDVHALAVGRALTGISAFS
ncbi:hypothetical protein WJX81_003606 [Elliptochloris bilobata]|uniref:glutaryl-CoA dehydrogenase (ETF) n=1 Tax=Elliptochloris bilobata TaxID=381761 RepID=A0AAW1S318_9CHLO